MCLNVSEVYFTVLGNLYSSHHITAANVIFSITFFVAYLTEEHMYAKTITQHLCE